jgi:hypothetical protein
MTTGTITLRYLDVPVLVGRRIRIADAIEVDIEAGSVIGLNVTCTVSSTRGTSTRSGCDEAASTGDFNVRALDVGVLGQVRVSAPLRRFRPFAEFAYQRGATNVFSDFEASNRSNLLRFGATLILGNRRAN